MEIAILAAQIVIIGLLGWANRNPRVSKRHARREELAAMAADYAEMLGGPDKIRHAVQAFGRIDLADNGKRDYSDAEARIAIEAVLARRKQ